MRKTCKGRSVDLTWMHDLLFQSQEPLREWHVACLHFDPGFAGNCRKTEIQTVYREGWLCCIY